MYRLGLPLYRNLPLQRITPNFQCINVNYVLRGYLGQLFRRVLSKKFICKADGSIVVLRFRINVECKLSILQIHLAPHQAPIVEGAAPAGRWTPRFQLADLGAALVLGQAVTPS